MQDASSNARSHRGWILLGLSALFVAAFAFLCLNRDIPLGVTGEWVWNRHAPPPPIGYVPVVVAAAVYVWLCKFVRRLVDRRAGWAPFALAAAMLAALPLHLSIFNVPVAGLERWFLSLQQSASSGYFSVARDLERRDVSTAEFLRDYEAWIKTQDSFHVGTHPPGLFVAYQKLLGTMDARPELAERVLRLAPARLGLAAAEFGRQGGLNQAEAATIVAAGLLTWMAVWLTAPLVYLLARRGASPGASIAAASLWLLTPGPLLFLPVADAAYALPAAAIGFPLLAGPYKRTATAIPAGLTAGLLFFVAVNLSLAFLVVLCVIGLAGVFADPLVFRRPAWWTTWLAFAAAVVAALFFCRSTFDLDLLAVYRVNLEKHRGFYDHFPRSYWPWVGVNVIEFAVALGVLSVFVPASGVLGRTRREKGLALGLLATLLLLDLTGKNLSEAARLWLFLTPFAAAVAAPAFERENLSPRQCAVALVLQAAAALLVYVSVEPLLPIGVSL